MAAILVQENITDLTFVFQKLTRTLTVYTERYPELMYISSGMKTIQKNSGEQQDLPLLRELSVYMKDKLSEYYVIKIMQQKLQQDIVALTAGTEVSRVNGMYLDFLVTN
jgi:hypothetical protein